MRGTITGQKACRCFVENIDTAGEIWCPIHGYVNLATLYEYVYGR